MNTSLKIVQEQLSESARTKDLIRDTLSEKIVAAADVIINSLRNGGKVLVCGNGGSAADSQHFVAEMIGRFLRERAPIPFIALATNTSTITAIGNDYAFDNIFLRQVEALGQAGDVLVGISTSGNSGNVVAAFEKAKDKGMTTVALIGSGGKMAEMANHVLGVPVKATPRIQEGHITIIHILCDLVEQAMIEK